MIAQLQSRVRRWTATVAECGSLDRSRSMEDTCRGWWSGRRISWTRWELQLKKKSKLLLSNVRLDWVETKRQDLCLTKKWRLKLSWLLKNTYQELRREQGWGQFDFWLSERRTMRLTVDQPCWVLLRGRVQNSKERTLCGEEADRVHYQGVS